MSRGLALRSGQAPDGMPVHTRMKGSCPGLYQGYRGHGLFTGRHSSGKPILAWARQWCQPGSTQFQQGERYLGLVTGTKNGKPVIASWCEQCLQVEEYSGSSSGTTGPRMPNGCAGCCSSCVCWWWTTWHKSLTASNLLWDNLFVTPRWTLIGNTIAKVGSDPDFMYFGNIGVGDCTISGPAALDENGDITDDLPYAPQWTGDLTYTSDLGTVTFNVTIVARFTIALACESPYEAGDAIVWFGSQVNSSSDPSFSFNGQSIFSPPFGDPDPVDVGLIPNDFIGGSGTITDFGGTLAIDGPGIRLPAITITPMLDPDCVEE